VEVEGLRLSSLEAEVFARAVKSGVLVLTPDTPVNSLLPLAWWRRCLSDGVAYGVEEVRWEQIEPAPPRECAHCGADLDGAAPDALYCSPECKRSARNLRRKKNATGGG
jgi:hypothetical protein